MRQRIFLFWKMIQLSIKSQLQYRASFILECCANFFGSFIDFIGLWVLMNRFQTIQGWTLKELAMIYGIVHMGFAMAEGLSRGFDRLTQTLKSGDFDRILLLPMGTAFQIAARQVHVLRIGRWLQGFVVFVWGWYHNGFSVFSPVSVVFVFGILGATALFYGLFVAGATLCFWTTESLTLIDVVTYGGREVSQYPFTIFPSFLRVAWTVLIPFSCVAYYPVASLFGRETFSPILSSALPFFGFVFLWLMFKLWRVGEHRYCVNGV